VCVVCCEQRTLTSTCMPRTTRHAQLTMHATHAPLDHETARILGIDLRAPHTVQIATCVACACACACAYPTNTTSLCTLKYRVSPCVHGAGCDAVGAVALSSLHCRCVPARCGDSLTARP